MPVGCGDLRIQDSSTPSSGEASSRHLTTVNPGEMSPGRKHLDGDLVSQLDLLWDLSSWGGAERPWLWWPEQTSISWHFAGQQWCAPGQAAQDRSLHLSLCGEHCRSYCSYFIGLGSWGLNELSKATQRARGRAGSRPRAFTALRGSSRPHCILKADIQQPCGLYSCLNGRQIAAFLPLFARCNICPDF